MGQNSFYEKDLFLKVFFLLTFKENFNDHINTKVIDIVNNIKNYVMIPIIIINPLVDKNVVLIDKIMLSLKILK